MRARGGQALRLQDRAGEAERLALEVRGLQAELRSSCLRVKELTLASAGGSSFPPHTNTPMLHTDVLSLSHTPTHNPQRVIRLLSSVLS